MISLVGWLATALVTASYFFRNHKTLRVMQALGAVVWLTYGILINSKPVMVANYCRGCGPLLHIHPR
jgi:uncharacterized protein with PQ loop repeat